MRLLSLSLAVAATSVLGANYHGCDSDVSMSLAYCNTSLSFAERTLDLVSRLTLAEKISLISPTTEPGYDACPGYTSGVPRIGLPDYMWLVETNTGVASACYDQDHCATTFVSPPMLASSFNRTSWRAKGSVIGTEMRAFNNLDWHRDIDDHATKYLIGLTGYGPNMNIVRDPRFGRNQELPSEDPFLSGMYASEYLHGMQEEDDNGHPKMIAFVKHFDDYSVEANRGNFDANVSLYDFFDSYLAQYEIAFKEGQASGAMCSYNAENGHPSCSNGWILNDVVRGLWGREDALIASDCGAVSNMHGAPLYAQTDEECAAWTIMNGTDLELGSTVWSGAMVSAIQQGIATEEAVSKSVYRAMYHLMRAGRFDPPELVQWSKIGLDSIGSAAHTEVNYEAALQGLVLLKNEASFLPLKPGMKIAVVGPHAISQWGMIEGYYGDQMCWDDFTCIPTIGSMIKSVNDAAGGSTVIQKGVDIDSDDQSGIAAAVDAAMAADVVILAVGIDRSLEHETLDRTLISIPELQLSFIRQILSLGVPTAMVVLNGGALAIDGVISQPKSIVEAWYPSREGARAIADTLFGDENRFGKLPVTVYPSNFVAQFDMNNMDMSKYPGRTYKYYSEEPLFNFGWGLSYTTFKTACSIDTDKQQVTCEVVNTGDRQGDEVVMMFHSASDAIRQQASQSHPVPLKRLVEFDRVSLLPGESQTVTLSFTDQTFALVNEKGDKIVYPGTHSLAITRNGRDNDVEFSVSK